MPFVSTKYGKFRFCTPLFAKNLWPTKTKCHNPKDTGLIIGNVILFLICLCFWKWQLVEKKLHPDDILTSWYCMVVIKMPSWFDEFFFWFVCLFEITIIWELHFVVVDYSLLPSFSKLVWHFPASYHRQLCQVSWFLELKSPHLWALEKSNYDYGVSVCTSPRKVHFYKKKMECCKKSFLISFMYSHHSIIRPVWWAELAVLAMHWPFAHYLDRQK